MISVVLFIVGGCHQQAVVKQQVVQQVVAQQVAYVPAVPVVYPLVQTYGVVDPYWAPRKNLEIEELKAEIRELRNALTQPVPTETNASDSINTQARAILERSCVTCHSGNNPSTSLDLTGTVSVEDRLKIVGEVSLGKMPKPPAEELPDNELAILTAWAYQDKDAVKSLLRSK